MRPGSVFGIAIALVLASSLALAQDHPANRETPPTPAPAKTLAPKGKSEALAATDGKRPANQAALAMVEIELLPKRDAEGFANQIVKVCLSTPKSKVELIESGAGGIGGQKKLKITDVPGCNKGLQSLAGGWDRAKVAAAGSVKVGKKDSVMDKLAKKHRALPMLGDSGTCPCLAFAGKKSSELAKEAASIK